MNYVTLQLDPIDIDLINYKVIKHNESVEFKVKSDDTDENVIIRIVKIKDN